jgi:putative toxin-antitoxin system antitoxin component (TIGR02293 family)
MMILQLATRVFEDRSVAMRWLSQPKRSLDGKVPLDLMKSDIGSRLVEEVLEQARHGFAS